MVVFQDLAFFTTFDELFHIRPHPRPECNSMKSFVGLKNPQMTTERILVVSFEHLVGKRGWNVYVVVKLLISHLYLSVQLILQDCIFLLSFCVSLCYCLKQFLNFRILVLFFPNEVGSEGKVILLFLRREQNTPSGGRNSGKSVRNNIELTFTVLPLQNQTSVTSGPILADDLWFFWKSGPTARQNDL